MRFIDEQARMITNHPHPNLPPHPLTEERTFQHRFDLTWSQPKEKPRNIRKPKPRKPRLSQPRVRRKTPEEQREARRLYDKTRSQKPERKEAMRLYAKKFQEERKVASLCVACGNQAIPGQTRCEACRDKHNESRNQAAERKPRAPKLTPEERIEARREYELTRSQTPGRKEAARLRAEKQRQKRRAARLAPPEQGTTVLKSLKVASCALG